MRQDISPPATERASILLRQLLAKLPEEDVSIGFIVLQMRRRSFGGILIVLAALGLRPLSKRENLRCQNIRKVGDAGRLPIRVDLSGTSVI